jgi:hypothetical protein
MKWPHHGCSWGLNVHGIGTTSRKRTALETHKNALGRNTTRLGISITQKIATRSFTQMSSSGRLTPGKKGPLCLIRTVSIARIISARARQRVRAKGETGKEPAVPAPAKVVARATPGRSPHGRQMLIGELGCQPAPQSRHLRCTTSHVLTQFRCHWAPHPKHLPRKHLQCFHLQLHYR